MIMALAFYGLAQVTQVSRLGMIPSRFYDGYGSGNTCQLPSIEGNKVVTHILQNNKSGNLCLRLRSNKNSNNHVLATFKVAKQ